MSVFSFVSKNADSHLNKNSEKGSRVVITPEEKEKKEFRLFGASVALLIITVIVLSRCTGVVQVIGKSMNSTLYNGEILFSTKATEENIKRGDVITFDISKAVDEVFLEQEDMLDGSVFIKRVIGIPGDHVEIKYDDVNGETKTRVIVNGEIIDEDYLDSEYVPYFQIGYGNDAETEIDITLDDGEYFVLGDNRGNSKDSRAFGAISIDGIERIVSVPSKFSPRNIFKSKYTFYIETGIALMAIILLIDVATASFINKKYTTEEFFNENNRLQNENNEYSEGKSVS